MQAALTLVLLLASQTETDVELVAPKGPQGFFVGLGLRSGAMGANADGVGDLGYLSGGSFDLRFGQMVNNRYGFGFTVVLGGGQTLPIKAFQSSKGEWTTGLGAMSMAFFVAPIEKLNILLHVAVGAAFMSVQRKDEALRKDDDPTGGYGPLYTVGISYDWLPFHDKGESGGFAVTPFVQARFFQSSDILAGGLFYGVEVSWWFGFSKNRLILDNEEAFKKK